jgi:DNA mismatch repair protein MutS2
LEFDRLKEIVSASAFSILGRETIRAMMPIKQRQKRVETIRLVTDFRDILNSTMNFPVPHEGDFRPLIKKVKDGAYHLTVPELVSAARILREFKAVGRFLSTKGDEKLKGFVLATSELPDLFGEVHRVVDDNGEIRDNATAELKRIRQDFKKAHKTLINSAERLIAEKARYLQEALFTTREERIVLPVLTTEKKKVPGIVHGMSQTQNTVFIEPMELVDLNNEYATFRLREEQEIKRILRELTEILIDDMKTCDRAVEEMRMIDALYGIASFSNHHGFTEPRFSDDQIISIRGGRHPLLVEKKGRENVIPFDVHLGGDKNLLLVSGPNMGGKTVLLKSIGIITLMAYAGMHIPAEGDSVIPEIESIFADIGDEQSIEMDLSTFSSHIRHITTALKGAGKHSLVLLDEVGVGTDPEEGMGIAMATLEYLAEKGALTFATTHYGKLKHFVAGNKKMCNASMAFDISRGAPTYHLSIGIPGSSHGFAVAEKEGFPPLLLERAKSYLDGNALKTEELVVSLEQLRKESEVLRDEAAEQKKRYEKLRETYEEQFSTLKQQEKTFIKEARQRAEDVVIKTRREMEQIIRNIRETQASRDAIKDSKMSIEQKLQSFQREEVPDSDKSFAIGDFVFSKKLKLSGQIIDVLDGYAKVESENIRFLAPLDTLEFREREGKKQDREIDDMDIEVQKELDIRGHTVEEAKPAVIGFIDHAILLNLKNVQIIHGKGTGALREAVSELLSDDKRVDAYRLGYHTEGGSGVTIVTLKIA